MATWILVIVTLGLLIATAIYAYHTKRIADASEKEHEFKVKVKLDFHVGSKMISREGIKVQFKFFNAGEVPIELRQLTFTWWFKNQPQAQHIIEKPLSGTIPKQQSPDEPIMIRFGEYEFRQHEIDETKSLQGVNFYKRISGMFRVEYSGLDDTPRYEERSVESLG